MPDRYQFIIKTIKEAGTRLLRARLNKIAVFSKGGDLRNVVTAVDLEINDFLTKEIKNAYPTEKIFSEEIKTEDLATGDFWSIDPIDGTANFARNIPHFAVCLSFVSAGEPIVGAVYNPVTQELFSFEKGEGVFLNGQSLRVSEVNQLSEAYVLLHIGRLPDVRDWGLDLQAKLLSRAKKNLNLGSSALDLCFLAAGRVEAVIYGTLTTQDMAVALAMVRAAGGEVYSLDGLPILLSPEPQSLIAVNCQSIFEDIVKQ